MKSVPTGNDNGQPEQNVDRGAKDPLPSSKKEKKGKASALSRGFHR